MLEKIQNNVGVSFADSGLKPGGEDFCLSCIYLVSPIKHHFAMQGLGDDACRIRNRGRITHPDNPPPHLKERVVDGIDIITCSDINTTGENEII